MGVSAIIGSNDSDPRYCLIWVACHSGRAGVSINWISVIDIHPPGSLKSCIRNVLILINWMRLGLDIPDTKFGFQITGVIFVICR